MKMYHREWEEIVDVVQIVAPQKGVQMAAIVFNPNLLSKQNGNGWALVKMGKLIPLNYMDAYTDYVKTLKEE